MTPACITRKTYYQCKAMKRMTLDLKRLRELYASATPGEWHANDRLGKNDDTTVRQPNGCGIASCCDETASMEGINAARADATLIVAMHAALIPLCDEVERLRCALERMGSK